MFACREPLAHLSFDLFGAKRGRYVDDEVFVECCDTYNQDAYGLASGGFDLTNISSGGRCCTSEAWKSGRRSSWEDGRTG